MLQPTRVRGKPSRGHGNHGCDEHTHAQESLNHTYTYTYTLIFLHLTGAADLEVISNSTALQTVTPPSPHFRYTYKDTHKHTKHTHKCTNIHTQVYTKLAEYLWRRVTHIHALHLHTYALIYAHTTLPHTLPLTWKVHVPFVVEAVISPLQYGGKFGAGHAQS